MRVEQLSFQGVRNLASTELSFNPHANVIFGENGAGKTSLLECLAIICTGKTFRPGRSGAVLGDNEDMLRVIGRVADGSLTRRVGVERYRNGDILAKLDGEKVTSASFLTKEFPVIVIDDRVFNTMEGGPQMRRNLLNWAMFHVKHSCFVHFKQYRRLRKHRAALLKQQKVDIDALRALDRALCPVAASLALAAGELVSEVSMLAGSEDFTSKELSDERGADGKGVKSVTAANSTSAVIHYQSGYGQVVDRLIASREDRTNVGNAIAESLRESEQSDIAAGFSQRGLSRSDITFKVNGKRADHRLSRGQKKRLTTDFILSLLNLFVQKSSKKPLVLMDDIAAELDHLHLENLLQAFSRLEVQCFYTVVARDIAEIPLPFNTLKPASMFHVKHGNAILYNKDVDL